MKPKEAAPAPASAVIERTPFVGRHRERAELQRFLDQAAGAHGTLVMIGGEAGIGKTRLAEELQVESGQRGMFTFTGHCYETEGGPPYIPFVEMLEAIVRTVPRPALREALGDSAADIVKLMPELRRLFPNIPKPMDLPLDQQRRYLFNCMRDFLERMARTQPLVLVLEDLHWADEPTFLLLQHLAQAVARLPILVIGTYRDVELEVSRPLAQALEELLRHRLVERLSLKRLPETDVAALLQAMVGQEPPPEFVQTVYAETEGNPFFVEEVFKHLAEEGELFDAQGQWRPDLPSRNLSVPESIRLVIGRRLQRLGDSARHTLTVAAVIGHAFTYELLGVLKQVEADSLMDSIGEAERAGLIIPAPHGPETRFTFAHELIRQTLVSDLSLPRCQRLHLWVAEAMEQLHSRTLEAHAADLAHQLYQAGSAADPQKTVHYLSLAGQKALAATGYEEAAASFTRALQVLELMEFTDDEGRCEMLLALGDAYWRAGSLAQCEETLLKAADIARGLGSGALLARVAAAMAQGWSWTDSDLLIGLLEEALETLRSEDSAVKARLLARLARELLVRDIFGVAEDGDTRNRGLALSEEAVAVARRVGDAGTLAWALEARSVAIWGPENTEARLAAADEIVRLSAEAHDWTIARMGRQQRVAACLELGDIRRAETDVEEMVGLAEKVNEPLAVAASLVYKVARALRNGRLDEAERLLQEVVSVTSGGLGAFEGGRLIFAAQMYFLRREQGRSGELEAIAAATVERYPAIAAFRAALATVYSDLGREGDARREFERLALNNFRDVHRNPLWFCTMALLAEVCAFLLDVSRAATMYDLLLPHAERYVDVSWGQGFLGSAAHYLGLLASSMRRWEEAGRHFNDALEMNARIGALPWVAHTQHEYGRMLLARRGPGDRKKAFTLLNQALATARELGMKGLVEKIGALIGSRAVPSPGYPDGLTQREVQVLRLIATGKSSREIGAELFLSTRTVERHITNLYMKIGAHSRVQAAAYALAHRLVQPSSS